MKKYKDKKWMWYNINIPENVDKKQLTLILGLILRNYVNDRKYCNSIEITENELRNILNIYYEHDKYRKDYRKFFHIMDEDVIRNSIDIALKNLNTFNLKQLREMAKIKEVKGYYTMNKKTLINFL